MRAHVWEGTGGHREGHPDVGLCFLSKQLARGWREGCEGGDGGQGQITELGIPLAR